MLEKLSQPASSVDLTLGKIKCTCCHCGARFTPLEIEGEYLGRRCPSCSDQLNEAEYDNAYLELAKKMPELQGKLDTITSEIQACKDEDLRLKKILLHGRMVLAYTYASRAQFRQPVQHRHWLRRQWRMTDKGHQPRLCRRHGRFRGVPFESIWLASNKEIQDLPPETDRVDADFGSRFEDESEALGQNSRHAVEFERTCSTYPCERVYEQVVFVGTSSFTMDCYEFIDNVNVSALDASGADFVQVIEKCCAGLDDLISQERVSEIGEQLLASYGDLNQQRARLHARRIKGLRESV